MPRFACSLFAAFIFAGFSFKPGPAVTLKKQTIKAPFGPVTITSPEFSRRPEFLITEFGAVAGNPDKTSGAIAKANETGGGVVVIPAEVWKQWFNTPISMNM